MWASHSPDFDSRRPHEFENVQIREGSCSLRIIRVAFLTLREDLREHFSAFGRNIGRGEKIFGVSKNSRWTSRCLGFVCPPGPSCGLRVAFVWPSGHFVWPSCGLRVHFVFFSSRRQHEAPEGPPEGHTNSGGLRVYLVCSFHHQPKASRRHPKVNTMSAL